MFRTEPRSGSVVELIQKQVAPAVPNRAFSNTVGMSVQLRRMAMLKFDVFE